FVLDFAGHDTTAHTFKFALYLLAAHSDIQHGPGEVRTAMGDRKPHEWSASSDFPRVERWSSIPFEKVRLYQPESPATLTTARSSHRWLEKG
ncbi:hypothetical protein F5883DRAFT_439975, partial [Diaporthe sp. PMI_573]